MCVRTKYYIDLPFNWILLIRTYVRTLYSKFTVVLLILQVSVVDAGGVGDVLETFPISSDPISCIASVPGFDDQDPEVLASE